MPSNRNLTGWYALDTLAYVKSIQKWCQWNDCQRGLTFHHLERSTLGFCHRWAWIVGSLGSEEVDGRGENFEGAKWLENKLKEREPIGVSVL